MSDELIGFIAGGLIGVVLTIIWLWWLFRNPENWWPRR